MARWLNWLERPVHTREVESSSLSLATLKGYQMLVSFFTGCQNFYILGNEGHTSASGHSIHFGFLAVQIVLPCWIIWIL